MSFLPGPGRIAPLHSILQESVLARSGGGIAIHPSFCPFSLFCLFDTCTTTQPSRPRGCRPARREGCTGSCRTRTRLAGAAPVAQPRWRLKWKRGCSPAARWRWRWRGLVLTSSRQDAVYRMAGSRGCASSDVANFSARGLTHTEKTREDDDQRSANDGPSQTNPTKGWVSFSVPSSTFGWALS